MAPADEQLMADYRDGSAEAFDALYARHKGGLYRYVLRAVRQRALAEELYQEIWIRVVEARSRYVASARFATWLYTIAHNLLVDHWRRKGLAVVAMDEDDPAQALASGGSDPADEAQARQALERFSRALEALPQAQREAFLLQEEAGLSAAEIAAVTASDPEAVKSRLRYAWAKLKAATHG